MDAERREAFIENFNDVKDALYGLALKRVKDEQMAYDLVQDAAIRAWEKFHQFTLGSNFKAWISRILINTHINQYRRRKREQEYSRNHTKSLKALTMSDEETSPHRYVELSESIRPELMEVLEEIPEERREVLFLFEIGGLSYKQIANEMDTPVGTVMSRLYRARRAAEVLISSEFDVQELIA